MIQEAPIVIGIAGGSASGKSTVSQTILSKLESDQITCFSHDNYYKDLEDFESQDPALINFDHPNSLETDLLVEHLKELKALRTVHQPCYNFKTFRREKETVLVEPVPLIIVEGILLFSYYELRDLMDIKIFVDTDADERLIRRIKRDTLERGRSLEKVLNRYTQTVKPMHQRFVEPSKVWADVIIPRGGGNDVAIDMVLSRIQHLLESHPAGS
jgi:uridine kinase